MSIDESKKEENFSAAAEMFTKFQYNQLILYCYVIWVCVEDNLLTIVFWASYIYFYKYFSETMKLTRIKFINIKCLTFTLTNPLK